MNYCMSLLCLNLHPSFHTSAFISPLHIYFALSCLCVCTCVPERFHKINIQWNLLLKQNTSSSGVHRNCFSHELRKEPVNGVWYLTALQTQDVWWAGKHIVKRALIVCSGAPACKNSLGTLPCFVHWKDTLEGALSCFFYHRGIQEGSFFLTLGHRHCFY